MLSGLVQFKMDKFTNQVCIMFRRDVVQVVKISEHLCFMLGFETSYIQSDNSNATSLWYDERAIYAPNLNCTCSCMYVYCNLIEGQIIGNTLAPLLRTVHVSGTFGQQILATFQHKHYLPLSTNFVHCVEIEIKDSTGAFVEFDSGNTLLTLHFRKRKQNLLP